MAGPSSCVLLSFLCISLGSVPACAASGSLHQLNQHDVYPCNISTAEVSLDQSYVFALKGGNLSLCPNASFNLSGIGVRALCCTRAVFIHAIVSLVPRLPEVWGRGYAAAKRTNTHTP